MIKREFIFFCLSLGNDLESDLSRRKNRWFFFRLAGVNEHPPGNLLHRL